MMVELPISAVIKLHGMTDEEFERLELAEADYKRRKTGRKTIMPSVINQDISIGSNLKALRLRNRLSQEDVATRLQVMGFIMSREIVSQMELGRHNIRVSILLALKELYHATFDEIFAASKNK